MESSSGHALPCALAFGLPSSLLRTAVSRNVGSARLASRYVPPPVVLPNAVPLSVADLIPEIKLVHRLPFVDYPCAHRNRHASQSHYLLPKTI